MSKDAVWKMMRREDEDEDARRIRREKQHKEARRQMRREKERYR